MKIVCIGDLHAHPDYNNKRFTACGEVIAEEQPDFVAIIGDVSDVVSLLEHGTKMEMEARRWKDDIECTNDALSMLMSPIRKRKKRLPHIFVTGGNHEHRIRKWVSENPKFETMMDVEDLGFAKHGIRYHEYKRYVEVGGFHFVHCIGGKGKMPVALNGMAGGYRRQGVSIVQGHTHTYTHHTEYNRGKRIHGIDLGCFIHKDMGAQETWSNPTEYTYWRGLHVFDNVARGDADFRTIRAETLGV